MTLLVVEVADFVSASRTLFRDVGEPVRVAYGRLCATLDGTGSMAGDDPGGRDWAHAYDRAARTTLQATAQVVNAAYTTSAMFARSGLNYADAEIASTPAAQRAETALVQSLPPETSIGAARVPPSAEGGDSGNPVWLVVEHTFGYVWPNGHQDRLHGAASAWAASAAALDDAEFAPVMASLVFDRDRLPEADDVNAVCEGLRGHLRDLAAAHRSLADACTALAHHLDECHSAVMAELRELLAETAEIEIGGGILSALTFGLAELPTQVLGAPASPLRPPGSVS